MCCEREEVRSRGNCGEIGIPSDGGTCRNRRRLKLSVGAPASNVSKVHARAPPTKDGTDFYALSQEYSTSLQDGVATATACGGSRLMCWACLQTAPSFTTLAEIAPIRFVSKWKHLHMLRPIESKYSCSETTMRRERHQSRQV